MRNMLPPCCDYGADNNEIISTSSHSPYLKRATLVPVTVGICVLHFKREINFRMHFTK